MANWRELASKLIGDERDTDPAIPLAQADAPSLPPGLWASLLLLEKLPPPALLRNKLHWRPIVADALRLARHGWAERALGLGWTPADIYGVGANGSEDFEGLAVWLGGRRIVLLDGTSAICANEDGSRSVFNRPDRKPRNTELSVVPLWKFGRPEQ